MYKIVFYETYDGKCPIWDFMEDLRSRSKSNKNARIQFKQISTYIELLRQNGTHINENVTKHIEEDIWKL